MRGGTGARPAGVFLLDGRDARSGSSRLEGWIVVYVGGVFGLLALVVWLFGVIDVIMAEEWECRGLPKFLWLVIVLLMGVLGALLWFLLGRPTTSHSAPPGSPVVHRCLERDRVHRAVAADPEATEAFQAGLRERAEAQRRRGHQQRRDQPRVEPPTRGPVTDHSDPPTVPDDPEPHGSSR